MGHEAHTHVSAGGDTGLLLDFRGVAVREAGLVGPAVVIDLAEEAGFRLAMSSEVNANPKDTADHPEGVWTLPPTLRLKEKDRDYYLAIGESDRMTLKFIKP